jgi:hypothetical protein
MTGIIAFLFPFSVRTRDCRRALSTSRDLGNVAPRRGPGRGLAGFDARNSSNRDNYTVSENAGKLDEIKRLEYNLHRSFCHPPAVKNATIAVINAGLFDFYDYDGF